MSGEKASVTKMIVDAIQDEAEQKTETLNVQIHEEFANKVKAYKLEKQQKSEMVIQRAENKYAKALVQNQKDVDWQIKSKVLMQRDTLWQEYEASLREKVIEYVNSKEYTQWLESIVKENPKSKFMGRAEDKHLFPQDSFEVVKLSLGGVYIETDTRIQDVTLDTRFKNVLDNYKMTTRVEV